MQKLFAQVSHLMDYPFWLQHNLNLRIYPILIEKGRPSIRHYGFYICRTLLLRAVHQTEHIDTVTYSTKALSLGIDTEHAKQPPRGDAEQYKEDKKCCVSPPTAPHAQHWRYRRRCRRRHRLHHSLSSVTKKTRGISA